MYVTGTQEPAVMTLRRIPTDSDRIQRDISDISILRYFERRKETIATFAAYSELIN